MKRTLVMLNLLAALLVLPAMRLLDASNVISAAMMYTELDRAQVIDQDKLKEVYPVESKNDRYLIPKRYVGHRKHAWMLGYPCILGFVANALLIGLFMKRKGKQNQDLEHISDSANAV